MMDWSLKVFRRFLKLQIEKAQKNKAPFVFINAWNEWGEGAYLEPDKSNGLNVLRAVKEIKNTTVKNFIRDDLHL
jgi:hypothetical protein